MAARPATRGLSSDASPALLHYGIYYEARNQAIKLAVEWFDQYLKK